MGKEKKAQLDAPIYDAREAVNYLKDLGLKICLNDVWNKVILNQEAVGEC